MSQGNNLTLAGIQTDYSDDYHQITGEDYKFGIHRCCDHRNRINGLFLLEIGNWTSRKHDIGLWAHLEEPSFVVRFYKGKQNEVFEWKGHIEDSPQQALYRDPFREVALKNDPKTEKKKMIEVLVIFLYFIKLKIPSMPVLYKGERVIDVLGRVFHNIHANREAARRTRSRVRQPRRRNRDVEDQDRIDADVDGAPAPKRLRLGLESLSEVAKSAESGYDDDKSRIRDLEREVEQKTQEYEAANIRILGFEIELTQKDEKYEAAEGRIIEFENELRRKDEDHAAAVEEHDIKFAEQLGKTEEAELKVAQIEKAKQAVEQRRDEFLTRVRKLEGTRDYLSSRLSKLEEEQKKTREDAAVEHQELEEKIAALQSQLEDRNQELIDNEAKLRVQKEESEALQTKYDDKTREVDQELEAARKKVKQTETTLCIRQQAVEELKRKLQESEIKSEEMQKQHGKLPEDIKKKYGLDVC